MPTTDPDFITVGQLIELLANEPQDAIVVMNADGGSGYLEQVVPAMEDAILDTQVITLNDYFHKR